MRKLFEHEEDLWNSLFTIIFLFIIVLLVFIAKLEGRLENNVSAMDFSILALAAFRLIRLFTYDSVTKFIRDYLGQFKNGIRKTVSDLINCPWCMGMWTALLVVFIYFVIPQLRVFLLVLAIAGLGSILQIIIWKIGLEPENENTKQID